MKRLNKLFILYFCFLIIVLTSCSSHYQITSITRSRILIDNRYDPNTYTKADIFLSPYKHKVDSLMNPIVGYSDHYMKAERPESDLSNLLADIMLWAASSYNEKVDFAIYNMGGIRATLPKGAVTYGDVLDIAPFENKICFLTLSGEKVYELFQQIAHVGGEGVSKGVCLLLNKHNVLLHACINGKKIDPKAQYRIATINYLAQGNDKLEAFKSKTNFISPTADSNNTRVIIVNYFKQMTAKGKIINSTTEGRITYISDLPGKIGCENTIGIHN